VSNNQLSGHVPDSLARLANLESFLFSSNALCGELPTPVAQLCEHQVACDELPPCPPPPLPPEKRNRSRAEAAARPLRLPIPAEHSRAFLQALLGILPILLVLALALAAWRYRLHLGEVEQARPVSRPPMPVLHVNTQGGGMMRQRSQASFERMTAEGLPSRPSFATAGERASESESPDVRWMLPPLARRPSMSANRAESPGHGGAGDYLHLAKVI